MYEVIKNVINSGNYELKEILYKINVMYVEGTITEEQKEELDNMARGNAKAENSYAPLQKQIDDLAKRIQALEIMNSEEEGETIIDYPEYVQPTGGHDTYKIGDRITYNGVKYECLIDNCVWSPTDYPIGWREIIEEEKTVDEILAEEPLIEE